MCDFKLGDHVVCVDDAIRRGSFWRAHNWPLRRLNVYTVKCVLTEQEHRARVEATHTGRAWVTRPGPKLELLEVVNPSGGGFTASRFRKVQKRKDSLTIESFLTIKPGQFEEPKRVVPAKPGKVKA